MNPRDRDPDTSYPDVLQPVALLDDHRESVKAVVRDGGLGGDWVEAEVVGAVVGNAGKHGKVLAVADALGVLAFVAGDHRDVVVVVLAGPEDLEIGHHYMSM